MSWSQLAEEEKEYHEAVKAGPKVPAGGNVDLGMRVLLVHGDEVRALARRCAIAVAACCLACVSVQGAGGACSSS